MNTHINQDTCLYDFRPQNAQIIDQSLKARSRKGYMKLLKKHVIRRYELTYLLPVSHTEAEFKVLKEGITQFLTKNKATVEETQEWGKRKLAYAINHKHAAQTEAAYVHVVFTAEPVEIEKIELGLKLNESIIRYLLIVAEQLKETKESKEKPKAKAVKTAKTAGDAKTE